jgi:predicted lipoprotein with Yx(FWY)xxD motif
MFKNLPTTLWLVGATIAVAALSPVVGQVATTTPPVAPQPAPVATATPTPSAKSAKPLPSATKTPDADAVVVRAARTELGPVAVDAEGFTLYLSVLDSTDPPRSVCLSRKCVADWRPLYVPDGAEPVAGKGIQPSLLGVVQRKDGTRQATLGGWPLYTFEQDQAPGDVDGDGVKGTWHAISPSGRKATGSNP